MQNKFVEQPAQFLIDSGLLFEINRQVLHPLGLAIGIANTADAPESGAFSIYDSREDAEGYLYGDNTFKLGLAKLEKFMKDEGNAIIERRIQTVGFIVQGGDE